MTINKRKLRKLLESWRLSATKTQERIILGRFSTEPWPYEWSEQDIDVQIQNYLGCGEFSKSIQYSDDPSEWLNDDDDFF